MPKRVIRCSFCASLVVVIVTVLSSGVVAGQNVESMAGSSAQSPGLADSDYLNLSDSMWNRFWEDFSMGSHVLDEFNEGQMSADEAFAATTSAYQTCSQITRLTAETAAPKRFWAFHNATLDSALCLQAYLWNLAKYFEVSSVGSWYWEQYNETGRSAYLDQASYFQGLKRYYYQTTTDYFNKTVAYMDLSKKERIRALNF